MKLSLWEGQRELNILVKIKALLVKCIYIYIYIYI